ncbi:TIGR04255 family protein [Pseudomonas sp. TWP3-1]|uniref:TIGR04255 family protein n=1 Tax=Pseudomonas sp. TWP3-1 TaxID=2804631 RepID=UPI003CF9DF3C
MTQRFANPPLVELVAEIRWGEAASAKEGGGNIPFAILGDAFDKHASAVTSALSAIGYGNSERLIPHGFPVPSGVPIVRFTYAGGDDKAGSDQLSSTVLQLGSGLFTVNAVQPYKSWADFSPIVEKGITQLLSTQRGAVSGYTLTLRYVDAFKKELTGDLSHEEFLSEVLGIKISLPDAFGEHATSAKVAIPVIQIVVPLELGQLQMQLADGKIESEPVYLMEIVVHYERQVAPDVAAIMDAFSQGRKIVHDLFLKLTIPLHERMKPIEEAR